MTQPPQPGPWDGQQPGQWQQGPGYPGGPVQPGAPGPYGGPGQFGPPQQQWPNPVPPKKNGAGKWVLGAVALVAVIAVTAVVAVSCTKNSGSGGGTSTPNNSGIASANDTGPVGIITEDPTCAPWGPVATTLSNATTNGWDKRDPTIPGTAWTPEQKHQYETVGEAYAAAANQTVALVKLTPHRVMRELYEQFISYARAYSNHVTHYVPADENLNLVAAGIIAVVNGICGSITYGSAAARAPLVSSTATPTQIAPVGDPASPSSFMPSVETQCSEWANTTNSLGTNPAYAAWVQTDSNIPVTGWSEQDKQTNQAIVTVFNQFADKYENLGEQSTNYFMVDLGKLAALYLRGFIAAIPTYSVADIQLYYVFAGIPPIVKAACAAARG